MGGARVHRSPGRPPACPCIRASDSAGSAAGLLEASGYFEVEASSPTSANADAADLSYSCSCSLGRFQRRPRLRRVFAAGCPGRRCANGDCPA